MIYQSLVLLSFLVTAAAAAAATDTVAAASADDGTPRKLQNNLALPTLFVDIPLVTTTNAVITTDACCDPSLRPDGTNGNPICSEGSACCPDGTWSCSIGDGRTFPCGGENVVNPDGDVCGEAPPVSGCCDSTNYPLCFIGTAACCPDGMWSCPNGETDTYQCGSTEIVGDPLGPLCNAGEPWTYTLPEWWDAITATYEGDDLKRCFKRQFPPTNGDACATREKTCFWGNQECGPPTSGVFPAIQCSCNGTPGKSGTWTCESAECPTPPVVTTPDNSCPLVLNNPVDCPAENPFFAKSLCTSASLIGETCLYGEDSFESCCGNCFASWFCSCSAVGEQFGCGNTDACFAPACTTPEQELAWAELVGMQCAPDAINVILADYPGMEVSCIDDTFLVTADFSLSRVRIFFDAATGLVSAPPTVG